MGAGSPLIIALIRHVLREKDENRVGSDRLVHYPAALHHAKVHANLGTSRDDFPQSPKKPPPSASACRSSPN